MSLLNPFETGLTIDASQKLVESVLTRNVNKIALMAPAGSGKTLAGIYFIYLLHSPRTVILSTRLSINQQWEAELNKYNNGLTILNAPGGKKISELPDILICTEQKFKTLYPLFEELTFIVIIDEAQNMLTENVEYIYNSKASHILLLSATYPLSFTPKYDLLIKHFKGIFEVNKTSLSGQYIHYYEDLYKNVNPRWFIYQLRHYLIDKKIKILITNKEIINSIARFLIISKSLSSLSEMKEVNCLIVRSGNAMSYLLPLCLDSKIYSKLSQFLDTECILKKLSSRYKYIMKNDNSTSDSEVERYDSVENLEITFNKLTQNKLIKNGLTISSYSFDDRLHEFISSLNIERAKFDSNIFNLLPEASIIISTNSRLQEGFNCPEIVFGIFNEFPYNYNNRIQLLCRIRRLSTNPFIKAFPRLAVVTINKHHSVMLEEKIKSIILQDPNSYWIDLSRYNIMYDWQKLNLSRNTRNRIKSVLNKSYSQEIEQEEMRKNNCIKINIKQLHSVMNKIVNFKN